MIAEAITAAHVLKMLYFLEPQGPHVPDYGEISEAIANTSNQDPLFPQREDGCLRTAAILVSLAWYESRFHKSVVGDQGKSFGLFQIQPPTAKHSANMLLNPREASYIAVDLIRTSFGACRNQPWESRLSWYISSNGCPTHPVIVKKSMSRMLTAERILKSEFPAKVLPPPALPVNKT